MTRERRVYAGQAGQWDERRNTSRVRPVEHGALDAAVYALAKWRASDPRHAAWIIDGAPPLTEREHVERFGVAYVKRAIRRVDARA